MGQELYVRIGKGVFDKTLKAHVVHVEGSQMGLELDDIRLNRKQLKDIINNAPLKSTIVRKVKNSVVKSGRRAGFLAMNTVLRPPIIKLYRPTFLFAVYGTESRSDHYFTPRSLRIMKPILIGGFIRSGKHRGLMVGSKFFEEMLSSQRDLSEKYYHQLLEAFPGIERIALVGRLPNFMKRAGLDISEPFVDGSMGTRYMIWDVALEMVKRPNYTNETSIVVLGGAGRIGNSVCSDLANHFDTVIAFDKRYTTPETIATPKGNIIRTADPEALREHRLFICLTHHGDVIKDFIPYFQSGSLIADDTHPSISFPLRKALAKKDVDVLKIVLTHDEFSIWPRMPEWNKKAVPGCMAEALVLLENPDVALDTLSTFAEDAKKLGFQGSLIPAIDD